MDVNQLMIPVYINEKIVLDMLAIIEDGFSTVSQVSYSDHKGNSNAQKIEAEVSTSASILSKLLKIDLKGELSHSGNCGETENTTKEKVHKFSVDISRSLEKLLQSVPTKQKALIF